MRIGCPGCDAAYEVPESQIRPGRVVQCARCGGRWQPAGPAPGPDPEPQPDPEPEEPDQVPDQVMAAAVPVEAARPEPALRHHSPSPIAVASTAYPPAVSGGTFWSIAWGASICLLITLGIALAHFRGVITHGWPATIRVYALFGPS